MTTSPGHRVAAQLGRLLLRSTRQHLYEGLVDGVDGLDIATYPVLSGLARLGPTTATRLAAAIGIDRSATTRYASRLEHAGLVRRDPDPADARATQLVLTAAGKKAVAATREKLAANIEAIFADWRPAEARAFAAALERFTDELAEPQTP